MRTTGRAQFGKYEGIINILVAFCRPLGKGGNYFLLKFFRNTNGKAGLLLRYVFLKNCCQSLGSNVSVQPGVYLFNLKGVKIGSNVSIHPMCYIDGAGGIEIGNDVSVAHSSSILSTNHQWDNPQVPIKYNPESFGKVYIENDVWIGCGVRILAGVHISGRSIVAAGAVVNRNIESNSIFAGIPAKKIKEI